jgi:putative hydrolase of the HAD superfamily
MSPTAAGGRRGPVWIFDLDDTLHDATTRVFPHINRAMTAYVMQHLGVDRPEADRLRIGYWHRFGATLIGLVKLHQVDATHFLRQTHDFPDLPGLVQRTPALRQILRRLPGRKIVFSNSPIHYCEAVLDALGIADCFEDLFTIERTGLHPKPDPIGFRRLLKARRLDPRRCVMVEDNVANLHTAKRLRMRTVLVGHTVRKPRGVDLVVRSPRQLAKALRLHRPVAARGGC